MSLRTEYNAMATVYPLTYDLRDQFEALKAAWKEETLLSSSMTEKVLSLPYQRIIGLGQPMVPILIEELRNDPDWWFWALQAITGCDPVPPNDRGDLEKMTAVWLRLADESTLCPDES